MQQTKHTEKISWTEIAQCNGWYMKMECKWHGYLFETHLAFPQLA